MKKGTPKLIFLLELPYAALDTAILKLPGPLQTRQAGLSMSPIFFIPSPRQNWQNCLSRTVLQTRSFLQTQALKPMKLPSSLQDGILKNRGMIIDIKSLP